MPEKEEEKKIPEIEELKEWWDLGKSYYTKDHKRIRLLDATDRGEMWKALGAKFPPYQILPDTNFVSYVKTNVVASLYTVTKSAEVEPTSEEDKEIVQQLNIAMDRIWNLAQVAHYQFQAGERAALVNLGITQVGWNDSLPGFTSDFAKGNVALKNIDPLKFMRDPFATSLETAQWCVTYDIYHKSVFKNDSRYRKAYDDYKNRQNHARQPAQIPEYDHESKIPKGGAKDYDTLIIFWIRDENGQVHEVHTINCEEILYKKENIKPSEFPFAELYCNLPTRGLVGSSECAKIFANNVAYNLMDSIALTAEYKNQRPPKFISSNSGLNIQSFAKHGDEADRTFVVNGQADKAVHYHEFPQTSQTLPSLKQALAMDMQLVTGVDERYTGRDTGSITTTGGTEDMLDRVTLVDTPKIANFEHYAKRLTMLILHNFLQHSSKRKYFHKKPDTTKWETIEVDFPKVSKDTLFNYNINISSELPKNKQRVASMANTLMEKQMQYSQEGGQQIDLITPEEWLMFQDLPMKEYMLERMGIDRIQSATEDAAQVLFEYSQLVDQGMSPEEALMATSDTLDKKRKGTPMEEGPLPPEMMQGGGAGGAVPPTGGGGGMAAPAGGGGAPPMGPM